MFSTYFDNQPDVFSTFYNGVDAIKVIMDSKGWNIIVKQSYNAVEVTKDGVTILKKGWASEAEIAKKDKVMDAFNAIMAGVQRGNY